jgi:F-type H+-transporting ATPase subunit b
MKKWIVSAAIIAAAVFPQIAIAAEAAAEEGGSWSVFAFFAINFILFAAVLIYFAGPPTIRGGLSRAESAFKDAQDLANKAAAKLAALDAELKQLADEMAKETEFQVARVEEIAKTAQARIRRDTELTTVALSEAAQRRVRERLSDSAATLARELIVRNFERTDQGRLIDGFMDKLGEGATR